MSNHLKILIVGGYGTFGGRIVELLEDDSRLTLLIAGRSLIKAQDYCKSRNVTQATLLPVRFDRTEDLVVQLVSLKPDIVVDASGPFQSYGKSEYKLVEACIANRINYLDLADGSDFVKGIATYDKTARDVGIYVLSGVSSFPVLTAAVVRTLSDDMIKIQSIRGGIAPSPYAGVGKNVIRAIAGYAGQKISLTRNGKTEEAWPLTNTLRYTISPPGRLPLRSTLFSLVDVPDLQVLADIWPEAKKIWMGAGPVPEILHRALISFAWLVRCKLVPSLLPMANLMEFVIRHVRWGEHRGGMFVETIGEDRQGTMVRRSWHLLAEGRDGPLIPSMAIESLVRKALEGEEIQPGARTALDDVTLNDYQQLFKKRTIYTGIREDGIDISVPLYKKILGSAWDQLPSDIRAMHDIKDMATVQGVATIQRGSNILGRLACVILRFPQAGENVPVSVNFTVKNGIEKWTRTFAGKSFSSLQYAGYGRSDRLLVERFGILKFDMALVWEGSRLNLVLRRWSALGIPLPMWLSVRSDSFESIENGDFHFDVKISHFLTGLIVHYKGELLRKS